MFDIRDMQLLVALERHGHFARAANECGISQPAFSSRIRNLELELGVSIVQRGNRFMGFTPEGQIVLRWARKMLQDADGMRQELTHATTGLEGTLTLGVIPTALAFAARIPAAIRESHAKLRVEIVSVPSTEIRRGLDNFTFDAGLSYVEDSQSTTIMTTPLYDEEYVLIAPSTFVPKETETISWSEVAKLPLCLLSRTMRNRRIIEEVFSSLDLSVEPIMETNALTVSMTQAEMGTAATIVPGALAALLENRPNIATPTIVEPEISQPIGLLLPHREPMPPALDLLKDVAARLSS